MHVFVRVHFKRVCVFILCMFFMYNEVGLFRHKNLIRGQMKPILSKETYERGTHAHTHTHTQAHAYVYE
jgi:hypothetical protein